MDTTAIRTAADPLREHSETFVTPVKREKKARRAVLIADRVADRTITIGGIAVIIVVLGIMVFLVEEVLPLFKGGSVTAAHEYRLDIPRVPTLGLAMDEYQTMVLHVSSDESLTLFHAKTGEPLQPPSIDPYGKDVTAFSSTLDNENLAFGFDDGAIRFVRVRFISDILPADELPGDLVVLDDRDSTDGEAVYSRIPGNQFRRISVELESEEAIKVSESGSPLIAMDYRLSGEAERQTKVFVTLDLEGLVKLNLAQSKVNLLTGERRVEVKRTQLPALPEGWDAKALLLAEKGAAVYIAEESGVVYRYNTRDFDDPFLAETRQVLPPGVQLTTFAFLLGGQSIVVGGSDGSLSVWFLTEQGGTETRDGQVLVRAREFGSDLSAIIHFDPSGRGKGFAVADVSGTIRVLHGTSQKTMLRFSGDSATAEYRDILLAPRIDGLLALEKQGRARFWEFSVPHPETTFRTLFGKVWYEGYPEPSYTWQSSAATDDFESKFSLVPLIFGTIKATIYSLAFAIPIAILGAIYTSEFVHLRVRTVVKPMMEMMATLPSVVLGFVAALVLAPIVESWIAAVILAFVALPVSLILAAYLWQMLPLRLAIRLQGIPRFSLMFVVAGCGLYAAYRLGPLFEQIFFQGDFRAWVSGKVGGSEPFLFLLGLPASFTLIAIVFSRFFGRRLALYTRRMSRFRAAIVDTVRWLLTVTSSVLCSCGAAHLLGVLGVDARGGLVDTYVQRNTLVVGFAMGFAVIPIIYTLAEDALNSVPDHLRAASLGCGATQWQTAIWVILPTAVSGVFSAIMIGMGRAVGETMIVVMSAGNTPIIDWNVFNGLRALSATIAVELPEAVKDGTLYRILFLAGLVLFAMTFVINTLAEVVRQHFRKRALQL